MYYTIESAKGGFRAHVYGANNRLVWWTEVYERKAGAENAIRILMDGAAGAPWYDRA